MLSLYIKCFSYVIVSLGFNYNLVLIYLIIICKFNIFFLKGSLIFSCFVMFCTFFFTYYLLVLKIYESTVILFIFLITLLLLLLISRFFYYIFFNLPIYKTK